MNKELKLIFEKFLDGKKATVKSGNLSSEASIEGEIDTIYIKYEDNSLQKYL